MNRYPDFLCIGAQKAGTSWLYHNFKDIPGIWCPPVKEIRYFNALEAPSEQRAFIKRDRIQSFFSRFQKQMGKGEVVLPELRWMANFALEETVDDDWYASQFSPAGALLTGEMSAGYAPLSIAGVRHIHALMPRAKIIFLMRNPIDRAWSQFRMEVRNGRIPSPTEKEAREFVVSDRCRKKTEYIKNIETWEQVFPKENIFYGFYEDIISRPEGLLKDILTFIDPRLPLPESFDKAKQIFHKGI